MSPLSLAFALCATALVAACSGSAAETVSSQPEGSTPPIELDLSPVTESPGGGEINPDSDPANSTAPIPIRVAPPITDPRVFMVGDSVLAATTIGQPDALDRNVARLGWDITVDARVSRFTDEGRQVVRKRAAEVGQVLVVVLGHNYDGNEEAYREDLREMFETARDVEMIVIVTVPLHEPVQAEVNRVIVEEAIRDPRVIVADWELVTRDLDVLSRDGLHPTPYGAEVLAQLLGLILGRAPGGDPNEPLPVIGAAGSPELAPGVAGDKGENRPSIGTTTSGASTGSTSSRPTGATTSTSATEETTPASTEPSGGSQEVTTIPTTPVTTQAEPVTTS